MIRVFVTGGTFDKDYDERSGHLSLRHSHVQDMLRIGRATVDVAIEQLMLIDSLEMTDRDRAHIVEACTLAHESQIVITHGTDTIVDTARLLATTCVTCETKTIVLTGAMVPYAFGNSDGMFNLGCALSFVQVLPPGVYVAMNGRYFPWNRVRKNRDLGVFESITD
jgi:L-asparaginase